MTEETLFATALEKADPADRAAFLADACPDPAVRRRVEELLAAHAAAGSFLDHPAIAQEATSVLPPSDPDVTHTQSPTDPDATAAPHAGGRAVDPDDALAFLKPSTRPGSLGRLDHYEVLEVLGTGGFGTVMKAFDTRLHRVVAVKVLAPQLAASGAARARFDRESRSAAGVKDDHVVNVYAVSEPGDPVPYLVMEFVAGQTLQQKLEKAGPLPPKEILRIGMQAARGLAAAHAQGIVHRDIKPANVLLENGVERVKITDFGLARAADDASISQSGVVAGTPMYMSPEQARGDTLDTRSDLFSLGSVLYVLCTGRPPFRADTTLAVLKRVVEEDPRPVREVNPEVPRWLADVVAKLHAKNPADRFQTAREVAELLAGYLAELQQQGTVVSRVTAPRRWGSVVAATGWVWWFTVPLVLLALLSAAAVLPDPAPPDDMPRREALFSLTYGFGFIGAVGLVAAALLSAVSRRWAVRVGAFTAAAAVAAAANGGLGLLAPAVPRPAVLTVRTADPAVEYQLDGRGPIQTGLGLAQPGVAPGKHWVWFRLGDREFLTAEFVLDEGQRAKLELAADGAGEARLDGRPLAVAPPKGSPPPVQPVVKRAAEPGVIAALRDLVGAKAQELDRAKARFDAGVLVPADLRAAEYDLADARTRLAEAEGDPAGVVAGLREMVRAAQDLRAVVAARVDVGVEPADALARADARVAEARERLARAGGAGAPPPPVVAPFTADQARVYQEAWAAHLGVPVEFAHPSGVAFRLVPPGEFGMGFTDAELAAVREEMKTVPNVGTYQRFAADSSGPRHTVRITRPFYLAKYETTAGQFRRFLDATKHTPTGTIDWTTFVTPGQEDRVPVMGVSWDDATAFGRWLGPGYELPTEAQWEYAARAGSTGLWSFGDDPAKLIDHAAVGQSGAKPGPVGLKRPNGFGLFDLHGGAEEWCRDWHVADFYRRSPVDDPVNLDPPTDPATGRVSRGGSWNAAAVYSKAAFRSFDHPTRPALLKGFRVALTGDLKAAVDAATGQKTAAEPGWGRLFNGTDLAGWQAHPAATAGAWRVEGGELVGGGAVSYLFHRAEYGDFHLRAEFRVNATGNSGVYVRAPLPAAGAGPHPAGYEAQIIGPAAPPSNYQTGSLVNFTDSKGTRIDADTPYTLEVVAEGNRLRVRLNGVTLTDARDAKSQYARGHVALQLWEPGTVVRFRKVEVRELIPVSPPAETPPRAKD